MKTVLLGLWVMLLFVMSQWLLWYRVDFAPSCVSEAFRSTCGSETVWDGSSKMILGLLVEKGGVLSSTGFPNSFNANESKGES